MRRSHGGIPTKTLDDKSDDKWKDQWVLFFHHDKITTYYNILQPLFILVFFQSRYEVVISGKMGAK
jgi:hypothetical protein